MEEKARQFNKHFAQYGGHFDYRMLVKPEILGGRLELLRDEINRIRKNTRHNLPEVYIDYINNVSLNALVSKTDEGYFIGINIGTYFILESLFFRILASKNILIEFGDVSKEKELNKLFNAQITDLDLLFALSPPEEPNIPQDTNRHLLAQILTFNTLLFLTTHEYGHIISGHLGLVGEITKLSTMEEALETPEYLRINPLLSQTLEMDADSFGCKSGVERLITLYMNIYSLGPEIKPFFSSLETSLFLWCFSIYCLFRLFAHKSIDTSKIKESSHPLPSIRQVIIMGTAKPVLEKAKLTDLAEKLDILMPQAVLEAEKAFKEISEQGFDARALILSGQPEAYNQVSAIYDNWNNVRPLLEKYAYGGLAPYTR